MTADKTLLDYLETLLGEVPGIEPAPAGRGTQLPLYLREKYRLSQADFFGRKCFLATEKDEGDGGSPGEYARHAELLRERLAGDVILVLRDLPAYARNRLVRQRVPFIVPGSQMFLPMLMIDLRERFARAKPRKGQALSTVAQLVILWHLIRESLEDLPLGQIAARLSYSPMAMSKAKDELEATDLCEIARTGRALALHFPGEKRELWQRAEPLLSSPIRRTRWIRWQQPLKTAALAGLTALSRRTMLADDRLPTYALWDQTFRAAQERGEIHGCHGAEDAGARLEAWKYDPALLATQGAVDPCSLYLSLRQSPDERVQKESQQLLETLPW